MSYKSWKLQDVVKRSYPFQIKNVQVVFFATDKKWSVVFWDKCLVTVDKEVKDTIYLPKKCLTKAWTSV